MSNEVNPRERVVELANRSVAQRRSNVDELDDLLASESLDVQSQVMETVVELSEHYPESCVPLMDTLVGQLGDDALGEDAALVIGNIAAEDPQVVRDRLPVLIALINTGGAVTVNVTYALASLASSSPGSLTQEGILTQLFALIDDDSEAVRTNVTGILSEIAREEPEIITDSFDLIRERLDDESTAVQRNAIQSIGHLGDFSPESIFETFDDLCDMLESEDAGVRTRASYALGAVVRSAEELDVGTLQNLVNWLDHEDDRIRQQATYLLADIAAINPDVAHSFGDQLARRFADSDPVVRENAIQGLANIEEEYPDDAATAQRVIRTALENTATAENSPFSTAELQGLANERRAPSDLQRIAREALVRVGSGA